MQGRRHVLQSGGLACRGSGGMLPQESFESLVIRDAISEHFQGEVSLLFLY